jgi:serine/threonine protein kinase
VPIELSERQLTVLAEIGHGSFGTVYKGLLDTRTAQLGCVLVAVKELHADASAADRDLLCQEFVFCVCVWFFVFVFNKNLLSFRAVNMACMNHPNVLRLIGVLTAELPMRLVLQFCENGSLDSFLRTQVSSGALSLTHRQKHNMAVDICAGMAYIHEHGFLHRDLAVFFCF